MNLAPSDPILAFIWREVEISRTVVDTARRTSTRAIFEISAAKTWATALKSSGAKEIKLQAKDFLSGEVEGLIQDTGLETVWIEYHPALFPEGPDVFLARLDELSRKVQVIPITGDYELLRRLSHGAREPMTVALKGLEASGLVGIDSVAILLATALRLTSNNREKLDFIIWGGVSTPEATAAFLACGARGVVFESVHWQTDLVKTPVDFSPRLAKLRPEQTTVVGGHLGVNLRFFDKGNSIALKELAKFTASFRDGPITVREQTAFLQQVKEMAVPALDSELGNKQLIPIGPEAAFAESFAQRFGRSTATALAGFKIEVDRLIEASQDKQNIFIDSPVAQRLNTTYPFIQGAMSWISDLPAFALAVSQAGGLPTVALGLKDRARLDAELRHLKEVMGDRPYAVNCVALPENPHLDDQLALLAEIRPPFVVVSAGEPSYAGRLREKGLEVIYVAADEGLLRLALKAGVRWVVLEGQEAGGHVGSQTTLTLAQTAQELKRREPDLFTGRFLVIAGGIFNRQTAFWAALMGADAVQLGTAYLATKEIVSTGALSRLYQQMILKAQPGTTTISGQSVGLQVRALKTPKIQAILELERRFLAGGEDESSFRRRLETLTAGSLLIAARGQASAGGPALDEETCLEEGQFMSGAAAGAIERVRTVAELHYELAHGPLPQAVQARPSRPAGRVKTEVNGQRERVAITGWALVNSLGNTPDQVWSATLAGRSGVSDIPISKWDHDLFYDPTPGVPEKTYCRSAAFQNISVSRKELGIPPQDFRTMAESTKLTIYLAHQALEHSGLLKSNIPRERIGVIVSQNSAELASTLSDLNLGMNATRVVHSLRGLLSLTPELEIAAEHQIKAGLLSMDDTTLLGRLNCAAGGFICNSYGFRGPSYSVTAACASSQVALYNAVYMIRNGVLDAAIVGGGEEVLTPAHFLEFSALGSLSGISGKSKPPEEASRPFDLGRDGMVLGEGGGMVILERESVARRRGAKILAYITGLGASNSDQGMVESQAEVQAIAIKAAFTDAGYSPDTVDLVECHATGTVQGDVQEVEALKAIFPREKRTVLTSFKSQIGHTLGASGLNSLIRGVMAMRAEVFPLTLNYQTPDPAIDLESWGFQVAGEPVDWPRSDGRPRRMMANSFGFGGANYVVHLEESLEESDTVLISRSSPEDPAVQSGPAEIISGVSLFKTVLNGEDYRVGVLADSEAEAKAKVAAAEPISGPLTEKWRRNLERQGIILGRAEQPVSALAMIFAGQGTSYPGMGRQLYETFPLIRRWMDQVAGLADFDLLSVMFKAEAAELQRTLNQQPALFCLEYAIFQELSAMGLVPAVTAGHSVGEITALCASGVLTWSDALKLVCKRAALMEKAAGLAPDPGVMLAVQAPVETIEKIVAGRAGVYLTNYNSPRQVVIGGLTPNVLLLKEELERDGLRSIQLKVSMAFHSPLVKPIRDEIAAVVADLDVHPPQIPVISNSTQRPYPDDPAGIRQNIINHMESPVHWWQNVRTMNGDFGTQTFVEIGPKGTLCNLVAETIKEARCLQTCHPGHEARTLRAAAAKLHGWGYLTPEKPLAAVIFPQSDPRPSERTSPKPVLVSPPKPSVTPDSPITISNRLAAIVQREINNFVIESFGKFLKPAILEAIRHEVDPNLREEQLDAVFKSLSAPVRTSTLPLLAPAPAVTTSANVAAFPSEPKAEKTAQPSPEDYLERLIRIIMEATGYERDEIEPDMDLRQDLAIRSSRLPVIMDAAEKQFGITINLEDFIGLKTVRALAERIAELAGRKAEHVPSMAGLQAESLPTPAEVNYLEQLIRIIMETTGYERDEIEPDMDLRQDLAIRSSRLPVIMDAAEKQFGIVIKLEDFIGLKTVRAMAERIAELAGPRDLPSTGERKVMTRGSSTETSPGALVRPSSIGQTPIKRLTFIETPLPLSPPEPVSISPGQQVILLSLGPDSGLATKVASHFKNQMGAGVKTIDLLADPEGLKVSAIQKTIDRLKKGGRPAGLVIVLDHEKQAGFDDPEKISSLFTAIFLWLKALIDSADKKFCLLVASGETQSGWTTVIGEGLLGIFMSAAQEYQSILFRSLSVTADTPLPAALEQALDTQNKLIQMVYRGRQTWTIKGVQRPLTMNHGPNLKLSPGEVLVLSGGGRGITAYLARALAPFQPRIILLGRSELPALDHEGSGVTDANALEIRQTLSDLAGLGIEAVYVPCDVSNREQTAQVFEKITATYGRIAGVIHGAGVIRDAFLLDMTPEDFDQVIKVKLAGAWNLYQGAAGPDLKFFFCLSSVVAIQGNVGQVNYSAANRAMTALMSLLTADRPGLKAKALNLPPIAGAGMADQPEVRELLSLRGMDQAWIGVGELSELFIRELILAPSNETQVLLARNLPKIETVWLDLDEAEPTSKPGWLSIGGLTLAGSELPMIQTIHHLDLNEGALSAGRTFSLKRDLWIDEHRPFKVLKFPLVSGIMAVETFLEAAKLVYPHLVPVGVQDVEFLDILECPPGLDRESKIDVHRVGMDHGRVKCRVSIASRDLLASGRISNIWTTNYQGVVLMTGGVRPLEPWSDFDPGLGKSSGKGLDHAKVQDVYGRMSALTGRYRALDTILVSGPDFIRGDMVYEEWVDMADFDQVTYQYPPYVLEALFQVLTFFVWIRHGDATPNPIPFKIDEVLFTRPCRSGERLILEAKLRRDENDGQVWDAQALDESRTVIMKAKGIDARWFKS